MNKPYSESCDQNRDPILSVIKPLLQDKQSVLEIGSGTGQHAVYFSQKMAHLTWQPSDQQQYLAGINMWLAEAALDNVSTPLILDVKQQKWTTDNFDAVFTANTLHIMHWSEVQAFFSNITTSLNPNGLLIVYGPFNYDYQYTSDSNARFDHWLKTRDPQSGIRHFEEVNELAMEQGFTLIDDIAMPANNRMLCWKLD